MSGRRCKTSHFRRFQNVSKQVRMSFCVASAALCDILTCLIKRRKAFCATSAKTLQGFFSEDAEMPCIFHGTRSSLDVSIFILRPRLGTLDESRSVFLANCKCQGCVKW